MHLALCYWYLLVYRIAEKATIQLKKINIDADREKVLPTLSETILPKTKAPGAIDIFAHLFIIKMVNDCYTSKNQQKFMSGLKSFETKARSDFNSTFVNCTTSQKEAIVTGLEENKNGDNDFRFFYSSVKKLTIQAYTTSKFYVTKVQVYQLVPGKFQECVPIDKFQAV